jgi:hypothetical protein
VGMVLDCGNSGSEATLSENGEWGFGACPGNSPSVFKYGTIKPLSNIPSLHLEVITACIRRHFDGEPWGRWMGYQRKAHSRPSSSTLLSTAHGRERASSPRSSSFRLAAGLVKESRLIVTRLRSPRSCTLECTSGSYITATCGIPSWKAAVTPVQGEAKRVRSTACNFLELCRLKLQGIRRVPLVHARRKYLGDRPTDEVDPPF